jgi:hypothetical protein
VLFERLNWSPTTGTRCWRIGGRYVVELTTEQFEAAEARGEAQLRGAVALAAFYDADRDRVIIRLSTGVEAASLRSRT